MREILEEYGTGIVLMLLWAGILGVFTKLLGLIISGQIWQYWRI